MRLLQNVLLVIGAIAIGVVSGLVLAFVVTMMVSAPRPGEDPSLNWGAGIIFILVAVLGCIAGVIIGFVGALRWIARGSSETWSWMVWIGVVLGIVMAFLIRFSGVLDWNILGDMIRWWPGLLIFSVAAACLGGILGGIAMPRGKGQ